MDVEIDFKKEETNSSSTDGSTESGTHIDMINYQLERSTHESTLQGEGVTEVRWQQLAVSDEGIRIHRKDYWEALIRCQPVIGLSCGKA